MFDIGKIHFNHGLLLAPMAGVTDSAYRNICIGLGAEGTVTEMVSSRAIHYSDKKTGDIAKITDNERPIGVQIFGSEPDIMAESAQVITDMPIPPDWIDINMGCPVKKIVSNGDGSALMGDIRLACDIVSAVVKAVDIPVTVKIRTGRDKDSINAPELARGLESAGAAMICVHGRTAKQMYTPGIDYDTIARVKQSVKIPVVANGSIVDGESAKYMLDYTGCDGLMLARGTMGNPWLFKEIICASENKEYIPPTLNERFDTAFKHGKMMIENKGEYVAVREARRQIAYYFKGVPFSGELRNALNTVESAKELYDILTLYRDKMWVLFDSRNA